MDQVRIEEKPRIQISVETLYNEACQTIRHYATHIKMLRLLTVAQGIVITSAVGFLVDNNQPVLIICASTFGLLLTFMLYSFYRHYMNMAENLADYIRNLEREFSKELSGPWVKLIEVRSQFWSKWRVRFFCNHALFVLLGLMMLFALGYTILDLLIP